MGTSLRAHDRIKYCFLKYNINILEEKINMIESFVFHQLITNFEERALRMDDSEGRRRARLYQDKCNLVFK